MSDAPDTTTFAKPVDIGDAAPVAGGATAPAALVVEPSVATELPAALVEPGGHADRCWLGADEKRTKRVVADGSFGLSSEEFAA